MDNNVGLIARAKLSAKLLGSTKNSIVLDIGSGSGWLSRFIKKKNLISIDNKKLFLNNFFNAHAIQLPFKSNSFDCVAFLEVIEHLPKNTELSVLKEINRVLKKNGVLVLSTPNNHFLSKLVDPAYFFGHRHYKLTNLLRLLRKSNFKVIYSRVLGSFFEFIFIISYYIGLKLGFDKFVSRVFDKLIEKEYKKEKGFSSILIKAQKR